MKSVMTNRFSQVPEANIPRSVFNRTHGHKTTFDAGWLVPIFVDEALPGDSFNVKMSAFARMSTPVYPVMDNLMMDTHFFSVPVRLVWDNWQRFMGERDPDPDSSIDYEVPYIVAHATQGVNAESLPDYMGVPIDIPSLEYNNLHGRAYNLIWNEWFRDQNLQDSITVDKGDGPDSYANYRYLQKRGKRHDYFTSCLPWAQKGDSVELPLGTSAPVAHDAADGSALGVYSTVNAATHAIDTDLAIADASVTSGGVALYADLSTATAATINQLRQSFQIQKLLERDARGGTRYTEILKSHFRVTSPDQRLQRPEYLGGGSTPVNINQVLTTTDGTREVGDTGAFATTAIRNNGFTKSFTEHCLLIGLVSVRADLTYQQGLNRMFSRRTRYDYYWPALAQIGEQAVLNKEIYAQNDANDALVFGYQERYAEYRYKPSLITGKFRSQYTAPLDSWHLAQEFTSLPQLNAAFIEENPPIDRVIATPTEPHFIFDSYFEMRCARPMPMYGVPGMIDHF